ncbi:uncharacterized protein LOC134752007 [Cydia strobilella]|uniref:uncharacterized protein LOC134752007 n=1 Tax=Cydia strobilella TaxID=1100964 RepID=UPI00300554D5
MSCAMRWCNSHHKRKEEEGYSFHRFPKLNTPVGEKWLNFLRFCNEDNDWLPRKCDKLCSKHFTTDSFFINFNNSRTYLKEQAVPTIIGPVTNKKVSRNVNVTQKKMPSASDVMVMVPSPSTIVGDPDEIRESLSATDPLGSSSSDTEYLDEIKKSPSSSDTMVSSPSYEMEVLEEFDEDPLVTQTTVVSSANKVHSCCDINKELSKKIKLLQKSVNRIQKVATRRQLTIAALRAQLKRLRKRKEAESENLIRFVQKEIDDKEYITVMKCLRKNPLLDHFISSARGKLSENNAGLKKYAMTLHLVSPRAYNFVREEFDLALPHPETVAKWCRRVYNPDLTEEDTEYDPGFTKEEYEAIKERVKENDAQPVYLVLMD